MAPEATLTMLGFVVFVLAFLFSETGGSKVVIILVFIAGIFVATSGLGQVVLDLATKIFT